MESIYSSNLKNVEDLTQLCPRFPQMKTERSVGNHSDCLCDNSGKFCFIKPIIHITDNSNNNNQTLVTIDLFKFKGKFNRTKPPYLVLKAFFMFDFTYLWANQIY